MTTMRLTKLVLDHEGMRELLNEPFVRDELARRAEPIKDRANAGARGRFTYSVVHKARQSRAAVEVLSEDPGVLFYEANSGNLLRAAGLPPAKRKKRKATKSTAKKTTRTRRSKGAVGNPPPVDGAA